ncbi:MAG TPA: glycosyltransferase [Steroidobacteraceae bacterium]|nr:glycosyltransferase [Steroidobacteraceae bacterium]
MEKVVLFLPSLDGGGAERVFVDLANAFSSAGVPVDLALARASGPYLGELTPTVRVVDFGCSGVLRSLPWLARHVRMERPAALLSALEHANFVAVLARRFGRVETRCVVSTRSVLSMLKHETGTLSAWRVISASRLAYPLADAVIANSAGVADDLVRFMGVPRARIHVIHNPLSLESIDRLSREPPVGAGFDAAGTPLILSVGRLSGLKDFPTLLRAFTLVRRTHPCRLAILGEGPDRRRLEALANRLGVGGELLLPGFIANPFAWMRRAALFVSSSISEGCPNALMQALACGTRVVSTDCPGGSREILEHGKWGRLVPVGDAAAMARAIVATLDSADAPDVRSRAADFSLEKIARRYLEVLLPREFSPQGVS